MQQRCLTARTSTWTTASGPWTTRPSGSGSPPRGYRYGLWSTAGGLHRGWQCMPRQVGNKDCTCAWQLTIFLLVNASGLSLTYVQAGGTPGPPVPVLLATHPPPVAPLQRCIACAAPSALIPRHRRRGLRYGGAGCTPKIPKGTGVYSAELYANTLRCQYLEMPTPLRTSAAATCVYTNRRIDHSNSSKSIDSVARPAPQTASAPPLGTPPRSPAAVPPGPLQHGQPHRYYTSCCMAVAPLDAVDHDHGRAPSN